MFGILLFFHLTGLAVWLGSIVVVSILLLSVRTIADTPLACLLVRKVIKIS